jgi:hypothetical protein
MSLRIENGALTIQNGFTYYPQKREIIRYFRRDFAFSERIILLNGSGSKPPASLMTPAGASSPPAWQKPENSTFRRSNDG